MIVPLKQFSIEVVDFINTYKTALTSPKTKLVVKMESWRLARSIGGHELPTRPHQTRNPHTLANEF